MTCSVLNFTYNYSQSNSIIYIKEISKKKKNKTDFSQHSCTNVFTAVADLQVLISAIYVPAYGFHLTF